MSEITLKPSKMKEALKILIKAKQPGIVWGNPGVGKSDVVRQVCAELGLECRDVRAVLLDPVDLRGLPFVKDGKSSWATPDFLPTDGCGVFFVDELNRAATMVQNAFLQLIWDRRLGDYVLPEGWTILAACNYESDGGGIQRMHSALGGRFDHLHMVVDNEDWCNWAIETGLEILMVGFMQFRPELLHQFDRNARSSPSPRTWEIVDRIVKQHPALDIQRALVAGAVGEAAEVEFHAFMELYKNLPNINAIMLDPANAPLVTQPIELYAVSAALASRAKPENFGRIVMYLNRIPDEYSVFAIRSAIARDECLQSTAEFIQWSVVHQDFL